MSVHKIALSHRQYFRWFAGEKASIGTHFVGFRIHFHSGSCVVEHHGFLADPACVRDWEKSLGYAMRLTLIEESLADKSDGAFGKGSTKRAEHGPVVFGLWRRDRTV